MTYGNDFMLTSSIKALNLPLDEDKQNGWRPYPLFSGSTLFTDSFSSHVSVLSPEIMPHKPHAHVEEELLIMLSGEAELVIPNAESSGTEPRTRICPGDFVYYPAFKSHTIHNIGLGPATYLMFKWHKNGVQEADSLLETSIRRYNYSTKKVVPKLAQGVVYEEILNGSTAYLSRLQSHVTTLQQGAGYQPHSDAYDVAILLLRGTVETLGEVVKAYSVIFYAAGEPHGLINKGDCNAFYLVFEFHGREQNIMGQNKQTEIIMAQNQKISEMEEVISELNEQNVVLKARLQNMDRGITWRMTMMFHNCIVERCFPLGSMRRNSYDLAIDGGRIMIKEGPGAFWQKFRKHFKP